MSALHHLASQLLSPLCVPKPAKVRRVYGVIKPTYTARSGGRKPHIDREADMAQVVDALRHGPSTREKLDTRLGFARDRTLRALTALKTDWRVACRQDGRTVTWWLIDDR